jgi:hypothetical protein
MGVELEIDNGDRMGARTKLKPLSKGEQLFYLKTDGSLSDSGIEIVTHPCTLDYHMNEFPWMDISKTVRENNYVSYGSKNCGFHVHVPRRYLTLCEATKLGLFVYAHVTYFERLAQRKESSYAKFKKWKASRHCLDNEHDRYSAINFTGRGTIEFRLFKGTLSVTTIKSYLQLVHATCSFVKANSVMQILKPDVWDRFCTYVMESNKYDMLKAYMQGKNVIPLRDKK